MKVKGQEMIMGLIMVFVLVLVFTSISPALYTAVSTYSNFSSSDELIVQLFPTIMAVGILMSILIAIMYGGRSRQV